MPHFNHYIMQKNYDNATLSCKLRRTKVRKCGDGCSPGTISSLALCCGVIKPVFMSAYLALPLHHGPMWGIIATMNLSCCV